ncbi:hypothetical protein DIPPA_07476 [Diplonema papillatum]|nr:hypothetical protein DIPPA_07476 [Diplonema papillatum]
MGGSASKTPQARALQSRLRQLDADGDGEIELRRLKALVAQAGGIEGVDGRLAREVGDWIAQLLAEDETAAVRTAHVMRTSIATALVESAGTTTADLLESCPGTCKLRLARMRRIALLLLLKGSPLRGVAAAAMAPHDDESPPDRLLHDNGALIALSFAKWRAYRGGGGGRRDVPKGYHLAVDPAMLETQDFNVTAMTAADSSEALTPAAADDAQGADNAEEEEYEEVIEEIEEYEEVEESDPGAPAEKPEPAAREEADASEPGLPQAEDVQKQVSAVSAVQTSSSSSLTRKATETSSSSDETTTERPQDASSEPSHAQSSTKLSKQRSDGPAAAPLDHSPQSPETPAQGAGLDSSGGSGGASRSRSYGELRVNTRGSGSVGQEDCHPAPVTHAGSDDPRNPSPHVRRSVSGGFSTSPSGQKRGDNASRSSSRASSREHAPPVPAVLQDSPAFGPADSRTGLGGSFATDPGAHPRAKNRRFSTGNRSPSDVVMMEPPTAPDPLTSYARPRLESTSLDNWEGAAVDEEEEAAVLSQRGSPPPPNAARAAGVLVEAEHPHLHRPPVPLQPELSEYVGEPLSQFQKRSSDHPQAGYELHHAQPSGKPPPGGGVLYVNPNKVTSSLYQSVLQRHASTRVTTRSRSAGNASSELELTATLAVSGSGNIWGTPACELTPGLRRKYAPGYMAVKGKAEPVTSVPGGYRETKASKLRKIAGGTDPTSRASAILEACIRDAETAAAAKYRRTTPTPPPPPPPAPAPRPPGSPAHVAGEILRGLKLAPYKSGPRHQPDEHTLSQASSRSRLRSPVVAGKLRGWSAPAPAAVPPVLKAVRDVRKKPAAKRAVPAAKAGLRPRLAEASARQERARKADKKRPGSGKPADPLARRKTPPPPPLQQSRPAATGFGVDTHVPMLAPNIRKAALGPRRVAPPGGRRPAEPALASSFATNDGKPESLASQSPLLLAVDV